MDARERINDEGGFTLAELLIVVAIILVLVSIAIPVFTSQLERSRESVDVTLMRDAYAVSSVAVLSDEKVDGIPMRSFTRQNPAYLDETGKLTAAAPAPYGKGGAHDAGTSFSICDDCAYDPAADYTKSVVVTWAEGDRVHVHWLGGMGETAGGDPGSGAGDGSDGDGSGNGGAGNGGTDPDPGETGSGPQSGDPLSPQALVDGARTYPPQGTTASLDSGDLYVHNGQAYVYAGPHADMNQYYWINPEQADWVMVPLSPGAKVSGPSDLNSQGQLLDVQRGQLFTYGDGDVYISTISATHGRDPKNDAPSNWQKITK